MRLILGDVQGNKHELLLVIKRKIIFRDFISKGLINTSQAMFSREFQVTG